MIIRKINNDKELLVRLEEQGIKVFEIAKFINSTVAQVEIIKIGQRNLTPLERKILIHLYLDTHTK